MATTTSIAVISVRGLESKDKWIQCAVAEARAAIAQLGERQTEDLKVPGSIPGLGTFSLRQSSRQYCFANLVVYEEKF